MNFDLEMHVEIILLSGQEGWSQRRVANEFSWCHPERNNQLSHRTVGNLVNKFKETGSVADK